MEENMDIDCSSNEASNSGINFLQDSSTSLVPKVDWSNLPKVQESNATEKAPMERFITILDQIDVKVEKLRKEALFLQEHKDFLSMSIDLLKNNEYLTGLSESEKEEVACYVQRISGRLATVELNVCTIRDPEQEDSLNRVNGYIDSIITNTDPIVSRQKCQQFLNACSFSDNSTFTDPTMSIDKKFEGALLGCTLDDQKNIKKRLLALLNYLSKPTIVN